MAAGRVQWALGVGCILFVAVVWTFATVLKQIIFQDLEFNEPLILAYVCNGCYTVHLPLQAIGWRIGLVEKLPWRLPRSDSRDRGLGLGTASLEADLTHGQSVPPSSICEAFIAGALISPLWFAAQWSYSAGVAGTSVTNSTVISTTSVVWTLLASMAFLRERVTCQKLVGIAACVAGNVATLWGSDASSGGQPEHLRGDILCLVAAVIYAVYTTALKLLTHDGTSIALLFGSLGFCVLVLGAPIILCFASEGLRNLTPKIFGLLVFNGIFDNVLSQYAWARAVQWTSPTAATVGLSLTIPLGVLADALRRRAPGLWSFVAAGLVMLGFVAVTLDSRPEAVQKGVGGRESPGDEVAQDTTVVHREEPP